MAHHEDLFPLRDQRFHHLLRLGYIIKEYFANYFLHLSDITFDLSTNSMKIHQLKAEPWKVTLVDTGPIR